MRLEFDMDIFEALGDLVLGDRIARGAFRDVYECRLDAMYVVKVERYTGEFHNVREWEVWQHVEDWPMLCKWFAPCTFISACGKALIQHKTIPLISIPQNLPTFFTDLKVENFGKIGKQTVSHDYAMNLFIGSVIGRKVKMRKVRKYFLDGKEQ